MDTHKQGGRQSTALTRASSCSCHVEAVWGVSPIPAAQPVALFARPAQEFSCCCYGFSISLGFLYNTPEIVFFRHFWAGDDSRRLHDAAPDRSFISRFLEILIYFIIDLSFLEIKKYNVNFFAAFREGPILREESRSRIFQKFLRRSQESPRCPWCGPTMGLSICRLNWHRNASWRLRDALGGDTGNECF